MNAIRTVGLLCLSGALLDSAFTEAATLCDLQFAAVDNAQNELGSFLGVATLGADASSSYGSTLSVVGFDPGEIIPDPGSDCGGGSGPHSCGQTFATTDTVGFSVTDGDPFGLLLSLVVLSNVPGGVDLEARSDFLGTATLSIDAPAGVDVTASPATVPLPASLWMMLTALLGLGARFRRTAC